MFEPLTLKPEVLGLDISDLSLKFVKLKREKQDFKVVASGEAEIKPGIIEAGEIKNPKTLVKIIKKSLQGIKTRRVVASLPEEKAFLQVIQMPRMSQEDLKSAVVFEAENYIPLAIEKVYLDFQIVPPLYDHLDHLDVLIAALPKTIVDSYLSCLKQSSLVPQALEIESLAIVRALVEKEISSSPLLLIDLGASKTGFIIFSGHSLRFTSSISVSSQTFTEVIAKSLKMTPQKAEKLKIKKGLEGKVFEALIPALTDLNEQIKKYIEYYQTHTSHEHLPSDGKGIQKIILCGGGAKLKGLPEFLEKEIGLPVELAKPPVDIPLQYTTALGLALRGGEKL